MDPSMNDPADEVVATCVELLEDLDLGAVKRWKEAHPDGHAIGCLPGYAPLELIHAAGCLPVGVFGGGDALEIIRGDAYFQSYICHIPRSVVELGVSGRLDPLDGFVFPSTCDVIRNLSGMWQMLFEGRYVKYFDVPQNFRGSLGGRFFRAELEDLARGLEGIGGLPVTPERLAAAIADYDVHRAVIEQLFDARAAHPERIPSWEMYAVMRAGGVLPVDEHTELMLRYLHAARARAARKRDNPRVVVQGAFCEQPPLALVRTLERAGCYVVEDDFSLQQRWIRGPVLSGGEDPWQALINAFLERSRPSAIRYMGDAPRGTELIEVVRRTRAEGVVLASPSFCDPSLLDLPMLTAELDAAGIPWTSFKYAENTGQLQGIREQAGTFSDSIRLWSEA
jgi:benzoyl-CoA reductase subunit C